MIGLTIVSTVIVPRGARGAALAARLQAVSEVNDEVLVTFASGPTALPRDHTLRSNMVNLLDSLDQTSDPRLTMTTVLYDAHGMVIGHAGPVQVPLHHFASLDLRSDDLIPPQSGSDRRLVRVVIEARVSQLSNTDAITIKQHASSLIDASVDVADSTGKIFGWKFSPKRVNGSMLHIDPVTGFLLGVVSEDIAPIGLVPGQTLSYAVSNADLDSTAIELSHVSVTLLAADGRVMARADAPRVAPGGFQSFMFDRTNLATSGEGGTGRLEIRIRVELTIVSKSPGVELTREIEALAPDSVALLDNQTGAVTLSSGEIAVH